MSELTTEQKAYIDYDGLEDTKLIACAGSGKTKCIIARIDKCIETKMCNSNNILMLTFSRFTRDDFLTKIKKYNAANINTSTIKTIDSFAKTLIDANNEIDVSLLSYRFMKYLQVLSKEELLQNQQLSVIKFIYVDEAQDLNEIQYNIFVLLKQKLNIILNFVGDPNQNIYQFRASSDKYFVEFPAKTFILTHNFRSHESIINFSKHLRPNTDLDVVCELGKNDMKPVIIFHETDYELEELLIRILDEASEKHIEMSDIAILAPTRGRMRGYGKSHGLCLITNILYRAGKKFKQFYEEATDDFNTHVAYAPEKGCVNVLTYMGSKGLEWKYVILIDADSCLINKRSFNEEKHKNDRYLLYVACSRAICNMVIFSRIRSVGGSPEFNLNQWFSHVPQNAYQFDDMYKEVFKIQPIRSYDLGSNEKRITKIIDKMDEVMLDELSTLCQYGNGPNPATTKQVTLMYQKKFPNLDQYSSVFLGKYVEALFYAFYCIHTNKSQEKFVDISNIIESKCVVTDISHIVTEWFYLNRQSLTWAKYDAIKHTLDEHIQNTVDKKFTRDTELNKHTIVNDGYFKTFILSKRKQLKHSYDKYIVCKNHKKIRKYLFDLIILVYALDTQHYFHVKNKGKKFKRILKHFNELFDELYLYVTKMNVHFVEHNMPISKWDMMGEIDLIELNDNKRFIWEIKCTTEITLKHVLQVLMYNLMGHDSLGLQQEQEIKLNFLNILKGEYVLITIKLSYQSILKIIEKFVVTGNKPNT